jgi:hypothetical protein
MFGVGGSAGHFECQILSSLHMFCTFFSDHGLCLLLSILHGVHVFG